MARYIPLRLPDRILESGKPVEGVSEVQEWIRHLMSQRTLEQKANGVRWIRQAVRNPAPAGRKLTGSRSLSARR